MKGAGRITNEERIQNRILRSKIRRAAKKAFDNQEYDNIYKVVTMEHYTVALYKCKKGVMWKGKPQKYCFEAITRMSDTIDSVLAGKLPSLKNYKVMILRERGKEREIVAIVFDDRITQRTFADFALVPVVLKSLIYDNGASTKGKGTDFARKRIDKFMHDAACKYGDDFYILKYDFKKFFESIPHSTCQKIYDKYFKDKRIVKIIMDIIKSYYRPLIQEIEDQAEREEQLRKLENNELCGITLGSQISQVTALIVPNDIDHYIKDRCRVKYYVRYMDDGIIIHHDKEVLIKLLECIKEIAKELGLTFNENKTMIVKAKKGFTFLKVKYRVVGRKVVKTLAHSGIVRMRRKLKKYAKKVQQNRMTLDDVYNSMQSWLDHAKIANSYTTVKNMLKLYDDLFDGYKITDKYFDKLKSKCKEGNKNEVLQNNKWAAFRWDCDYCGIA